MLELLTLSLLADGMAEDIRTFSGPSFIALDTSLKTDKDTFLAYTKRFAREKLGFFGFHVDAWEPVLISDPGTALGKIKDVAGEK